MTVSKYTGMPSLQFHETECFRYKAFEKKGMHKKNSWKLSGIYGNAQIKNKCLSND